MAFPLVRFRLAAERRRLLGEAETAVLAAAAILPIAQFHLLSAASPAVRDLVIGSELRFTERGEHELKGIPDRWSLYALDQ